jgi:hypothetical protein
MVEIDLGEAQARLPQMVREAARGADVVLTDGVSLRSHMRGGSGGSAARVG